ncbi:MAG: hypothetical protein COA67_12585 [Lutibacter sp.]|nr:MAG: hypothetical protein COA67_12585 [Lutibacter sp.]
MMNYKKTLFFIGKCLTISYEEKNRLEIEKELKSNSVDWDSVVKVSTAHYVFPALYCNLKRTNFIHYLPKELVEYMIYITNLNRERNQQIIVQAKEINELLLANNITPIFLKGTGNLIEELYEDIAERMVGDIDILVAKHELKETITVLRDNGYENVLLTENTIPNHRHYPRLVKKDSIGSVEVHHEMLIEKHSINFNYQTVKPSVINYKNFSFLGLEDQLKLTILSKQVNDDGHFLKNISFKNSYDVFLLSKKINTLKVVEKTSDFSVIINSFMATTATLLNYPKSIAYISSKSTKLFVKSSLKNYNNKLRHRFLSNYILLRKTLVVLSKSFTSKEHRNYIISRLKQSFKQNT